MEKKRKLCSAPLPPCSWKEIHRTSCCCSCRVRPGHSRSPCLSQSRDLTCCPAVGVRAVTARAPSGRSFLEEQCHLSKQAGDREQVDFGDSHMYIRLIDLMIHLERC